MAIFFIKKQNAPKSAVNRLKTIVSFLTGSENFCCRHEASAVWRQYFLRILFSAKSPCWICHTSNGFWQMLLI